MRKTNRADAMMPAASPSAANLAAAWDDAYRHGMTMWHPAECLIRFTAKYIKKQTGHESFQVIRNFRDGLDLGCGNGANVLFLRRLGYDMVGVDISPTAVELGNRLLIANGFLPCLRCEDIALAELGEAKFGFVVSHAALDHILFEQYLNTIGKIEKALKPGGLLFMTLRGMEAFGHEQAHAVEIENGTLLSGDQPGTTCGFENPLERNVPQHYFTREEIEESLANFAMLELQKTVEFCGENLEYVDSRWFITAQLS